MNKFIAYFENYTFPILSFSIYGLLFALRPMTLVPTLIVLVAFIVLVVKKSFRQNFWMQVKLDDQQIIIYPIIFWFAACLFIGIYHLGFERKFFPENAFRVLLSISIFSLFVGGGSKRFFVAGLIAGSFFSIIDVLFGYLFYDEYFPRISGTTNHPIHFGNFSALLAVLLFTTAAVSSLSAKKVRLICLGGAILATMAAIASLTRSSLIVLICLTPIFVVSKLDGLHKKIITLCFVAFIASASLLMFSSGVQEKLRFNEAVSDIDQVERNNYGNSLGARFAMWKTASLLFKDNPILGVGPARFDVKFTEMMEAGVVPKTGVFNQPHNDILNAASSGGLLKMIAYLLLMVGPFLFFYKKYKANRHDLAKRVFPIMGMQVVAAFFIAGLTNSNFDLQIYSTMYAVLVCVLARLSVFEINATEPSTPLVQAAPNC
jgi:O-antigen ligase